MDDNTVIVLLGAWVICGFIAAAIAYERGGSAIAGFFVGLIFGPVGVFASLFMGSERGRQLKEFSDGARKQCPQCAELVLSEARICKHCRHEFAARG